VCGDVHTTDETPVTNGGLTAKQRLQKFVDDVGVENIKKAYDFIIVVGDISMSSVEDTSSIDTWLNDFAYQIGIPIYPVPGNHDGCERSVWQAKIGRPAQYTFETDDFIFIMLDKYKNIQFGANPPQMYSPVTTEEFTWMEDIIAISGDKKLIICGHYFDSTLDATFFAWVRTQQKVIGLMFGHSHIYSATRNGDHFELNPGSFTDPTHEWPATGYQNNLWGFCEVEIKDNQLVTRHIQPAHFYPYYATDYPDGFPYTVSADYILYKSGYYPYSNRADFVSRTPGNGNFELVAKLKNLEARLAALET
jgi:predicted phosphodiesterase